MNIDSFKKYVVNRDLQEYGAPMPTATAASMGSSPGGHTMRDPAVMQAKASVRSAAGGDMKDPTVQRKLRNSMTTLRTAQATKNATAAQGIIDDLEDTSDQAVQKATGVMGVTSMKKGMKNL